MKNININLIVFLMSSFCLIAQNKYTTKADKHFSKYEFVEAAAEYVKIADSGDGDIYVYSQLGEAYYNIFSTKEAERWYAKALEIKKDSEMIYKYTLMLKANGKYDESNLWMQIFAEMEPKDERAIAFKTNPDYIPDILNIEKQFEIKTLEFNSVASDFGGTVQNGTLYFSSARNNARKNYRWNEEPFLDVFEVNITNEISEAETVKGDINTRHHEGLVSFSPDGNTMYFSRESFFDRIYEKVKETRTKISVLHLYRAKKDEYGWGNVQALPFNSDKYSVKNPSVSNDGKILYFASDMSGGYGKFDIYKVVINEDGSFGEIKNLGNKVNTEGQEMFPFISDNSTLYFSSNGHLGLGGLDVFHTTDSGEIKNLGIPINSNSDDLAFTINEETGEGFVSSNREGGQGSDDIYALKRNEPCNVIVSTTVIDNVTNNPLADVELTIKDENGRVLFTQSSDSNGNIKYTVSCEKLITISGVLTDYESSSLVYDVSKEKEESIKLYLDPIDKIIVGDRVVLNPILFDFDKSNITEQGAFELDKLVAVMNKYPEIIISSESHTDIRGSNKYNEGLSDRRAKSTVQYVISKGIDVSRISGIGKGEYELKVDCGSKCTEEEHQMNRRSEFIIVSGNPNREE